MSDVNDAASNMNDAASNVASSVQKDPAEQLGISPQATLPKVRPVVLKRPGNINVAGERGNFPGCRAVMFSANGASGLDSEDERLFRQQLADECNGVAYSAADAANCYFRHRANLLTVSEAVDASGNMHILFTNQIEGEMLEEFEAFTSEWEQVWSKRLEERRTREAQEEEKRNALRLEEKTLAELGRKARDHKLVEKLRQLEEELTQVKKENNRLKKKLGKEA